MFWISYLILSIFLTYLISKIFNNIYLKVFFINLFFSLFIGIWFISPGSEEMAPILSILLLESSILESNGFERLFRPLLTIFFLSLSVSIIFLFFKTKN